MTTAAELQKQFHSCMPIFIALGDKVRLSIIEALTENAMALDSPCLLYTSPSPRDTR